MVIFASHVGKIVQIAFKMALRGKSYRAEIPLEGSTKSGVWIWATKKESSNA